MGCSDSLLAPACCSNSQGVKPSKKNNKNIIVSTLNYGGILNSPLEFYSDNETEERQISQKFKNLIPQYFKSVDMKSFKWNVGKIDLKIQQERFTPIYRQNVGIQGEKLMTKDQFINQWNLQYEKAASNVKIQPEPTKQQVQNLRTFDLMCYHALLKQIYNIKSMQDLANNSFDVEMYRSLSTRFFSKSFLNQERKINLVMKALQTHCADIFCFQQPTKRFIAQLKKDKRFHISEKEQDISLVVLRVSSFQKIIKQDLVKQKLTSDQLEQLNWNKDTSYLMADKYIIISGHLSSKKQKNAKEVLELKQSLRVLSQKLPDYHIIVGADTNSFVTKEGMPDKFNIYPDNKNAFTTCKKRTFMQPQFNKADQINQECKDQIITTLLAQKVCIMTIQGKQITRSFLLPTDAHPFDHFMVVCYLKRY